MGIEVQALDPRLAGVLRHVSTATLTTVLLKQGLRNVWLRGTRPLGASQPRAVGRAFTMRFIAAREDMATPASWSSPISTRTAVEAMAPACICVAGAMGVTDAGILGDILCARMRQIGVAALVTDGVVRDASSVMRTHLPVWCQGAAAPPAVASLIFVGWQEPIDCGGVAIFPNDVIVADDDGAVVIPAALVEAVAQLALEQEQLETWIIDRVNAGEPLPGLYPPSAETLLRYEKDKAA